MLVIFCKEIETFQLSDYQHARRHNFWVLSICFNIKAILTFFKVGEAKARIPVADTYILGIGKMQPSVGYITDQATVSIVLCSVFN